MDEVESRAWALHLAGLVAADGSRPHPKHDAGDDVFLAVLDAVTPGQWARLRVVLNDLDHLRPESSWPDYAVEARVLMDLLYEMGLVVPFDWPAWWARRATLPVVATSEVSAADAVRLITVFLRTDRFDEVEFGARIAEGTLPALLERLLAGRPAG